MELKKMLVDVELDADSALKTLSSEINKIRKIQLIVTFHHIKLFLKEHIANHPMTNIILNINLREDGYGHYMYSRLMDGEKEYDYSSDKLTEDFAQSIFDTIDKIYVTNLNLFGKIVDTGEYDIQFGKFVEDDFEDSILSEDCKSTYRATLLDIKLKN